MAVANPSIPRGLKRRGRTWHISRVFNGRLVRLSTGCSDLEGAMRVYRRVEAGELAQPKTGWWSAEIDAARAGQKSVFGAMLAAAKSRAKRKGMSFDLTMPKVLALAAESGGYCAVSAVQFSGQRMGTRRPLMPSLDRIDCSRGYEFTNCRLVCVVVNYAISDFGEGALRIVARSIVSKELEALSRSDRACNSVQ
jgi:hypothetical protein